MTKIALLIPWWKPGTDEEGYVWETPSERKLSGSFETREQALANRPAGYACMDDGWHQI